MIGKVMGLQDIRSQAYEMAEADPLISIIRSFTMSDNKEFNGFLIVDKSTPSLKKYEELSAFYFSASENKLPAATCIINTEDYQKILDKKIKLPETWILGDVLFEGCFIFKDIARLIKSVQNWGYSVEITDDSMRRVLGFKCKSGRRWEIKLVDLKNSISTSKLARDFSTKESKELFLQYLNTKPPYEEASLGDKK
jgi:hypothetical protein